MGGDACSEGSGFESQDRILDGHFFTFICCKICNVCFLKNERDFGWPESKKVLLDRQREQNKIYSGPSVPNILLEMINGLSNLFVDMSELNLYLPFCCTLLPMCC